MNHKGKIRLGVLALVSGGLFVSSGGLRDEGKSPASSRDSVNPPRKRAGVAPAARPAGQATPEEKKEDGTIHAMRVGRGSRSYEVAAGEVLIRTGAETSSGDIEVLARSLGSRVLRGEARSGLYRLEVPQGQTMEAFRASLMAAPEVQDATFNAIAQATAVSSCPGGVNRSKQWNLDSIQQVSACSSFNTSLNSIVVAVLDSGVAFENYADGKGSYTRASDLAPVTFVPGYDFANNDSHPNDDNQHGTHIAGIVGAQGGVIGVAPGVKIMPIKVLNADKRGYEMDVVNGILYAVDHGANVINMSFSFGTGYFPSTALQAAISYAADHNVIMVGSAGNDSNWGVSYPGAFPDVISVGASRPGIDSSYQAAYSNKGYRLDILAPGGLIGADLGGLGQSNGILAQTFSLKAPGSMGYWFFSGTSQAAAHVTGAAAWLLADGLAPGKVKDALVESAFNMGGAGYDPNLGSGSLQLQAARDMVRLRTVQELPSYYVNIVPFIRRVSGMSMAVARIEVMTANGQPAANVKVGGSWFGSYTAFDALATTDSNGVAWATTPQFYAPGGVAVSFQVDMVAGGGARFPTEPRQFYSLTPATAEVFSRLQADAVAGNAVLLYKIDPADAALSSLIPTSGLVRTYVMKPAGAGLRTGPLALAIDDTFAPKLAAPDAGTASPINWTFPAALYSGRGAVTSVSGTLINAASPVVGPAPRVLVIPLDPAMGRRNLNNSYPVINGYDSEFTAVNQSFGNTIGIAGLVSGFPTSSMGTGFASRTLGDGFMASTLGSGFMASTLGSGFMASTLGSGFMASTLGSGFMASTLGSGFMASTLGSGFMASTLGSGFMSSLLYAVMTNSVVATGYASAMDGSSYESGTLATSFTELEMDGVSGSEWEPVDLSMPYAEGIELDQLDPADLISTEEELQEVLGVPPYPGTQPSNSI